MSKHKKQTKKQTNKTPAYWKPCIWLVPTTGVIAPHVRNAIAKGLRNLGCKVLDEDWGKMLERIWEDIRTKPHWRELLALRFLHNIKQRGVDLMMAYAVNFCIRVEQTKEVLNPMSLVNFPSMSLFFDQPYNAMTEFSEEEPKKWRNFHTMVWDEYWRQDMIAKGYPEPGFLPLGTDPDLFSPISEAERNDPNLQKFVADVSFVGTHSVDRERVLAPLAHLNLAVWGNETWGTSSLSRNYRGPVNYLTEAKYVYQLSKINLNVDMAQLKWSINNRVYDVLVGGGFLITEDKKDIHRLFEPGKHVVIYDNPDNLLPLVEEWLAKPEERLRMGLEGRKHVLAHHTWTHRAYQILQFIGNKLNWDLSWLEEYKSSLNL